MRSIVLIAHNLRSTHNVGSLLRTAEGLGVDVVYLTGYTPYPHAKDDPRLPHESAKLTKQIHKTALGAEASDFWQYELNVFRVISKLKQQGYTMAALEQTPDAISLPKYTPPTHIALVVGREVEGVETEIIKMCDLALEIPMFGKKESYNVVQSAAMALYHLKFHS